MQTARYQVLHHYQKRRATHLKKLERVQDVSETATYLGDFGDGPH